MYNYSLLKMYLDAIPELERILKSKEVGDNILWPICYGVKRGGEGYLLEDLCVSISFDSILTLVIFWFLLRILIPVKTIFIEVLFQLTNPFTIFRDFTAVSSYLISPGS